MQEEFVTINFRVLFGVLWKEKWWIILFPVIAGLVGLFYAFSVREEFVSHGKILPEIQGKSGGLAQFSGIAALAGVDLGSAAAGGADAIRPDLYPDVITSTPFYLELLKINVKDRENQDYTFENYYHKIIEEGKEPDKEFLKEVPVKEEGIVVVNMLNENRLEDLRSRITSSIDKKTGIISISAKMPDPVVAAEVTKFAMGYLMSYVKEYRTEKLKRDVEYLRDQVSSSRGKYYSTQEKKASYSDQFQMGTIREQSADVQRERIESEYRLTSSFYNELLKKLEEAKFKLHQETPVFQILEAPVVPNLKSEPRKALILLLALFLGGIFSLCFILIKEQNFRQIFKS